MSTPEDAKRKAATTYNAASDCYDHPANSFWERYGRRTVERLQLPPGARVLDVCCGSGASAIPAAEAVGPDGVVIGVDLAENLLELGRTKAKQNGLTNVDFRNGDFLDLQFPEASFDAVICVFGIFFVPDMAAAVDRLWHFVRPGGKLAITTWGPRFFEPASTAFWNAIRRVNPELYKDFNPWDRITEPDSVRAIFTAAGIKNIDLEIFAEAGSCLLRSADDWWPMVLGTGYRGTVDQLDAATLERVRQENLDFIRQAEIRSVEANVIYAIGERT